jgi:hypothetical protein
MPAARLRCPAHRPAPAPFFNPGREIDAINEPYRPIPSGKISEEQVVTQFLALLAAGLGTAALLDVWAGHDKPVLFGLAVFGSFISYIYSAPPLKLKQSGWAGNYALGSSYIALPWWAGQVHAGLRFLLGGQAGGGGAGQGLAARRRLSLDGCTGSSLCADPPRTHP